MSKSIEDIEGIGPAFAEKLRAIGIKTTDRLLAAGATRDSREQLAQTTGLGESLLLKWVNMADLFRIKGVAGQYSELLECSGVDSVRELRNRNAANLAQAMAEANRRKRVCKNTPNDRIVGEWIEQAKTLPPAVEH